MSCFGCRVLSHAAPIVPLAWASKITGVICASSAYALASGKFSSAIGVCVLLPGRPSLKRAALLTPNGE